MTRPPALPDLILPAWRTNARVTADLVRALPAGVYRAPVPGLPRRTVRMMAAHLHNSRCGWLRTLGQPHDIPVPGRVNPAGEDKPALLRALRESARGMEALFRLACEREGQLPPTARYAWRNLALDAGHLLTYFVAHEAHHRGQLLLIARQLGTPLERATAGRLWWWKPAARAGR
ncbi:MAG: DinB family protein [Gemmatimonadetes bacterium]|nr:DinB family protein [Gemmatimonadota bacterium]MBK7717534.1 DinB family protein [Gemmatimonadota bacterium]MBK7922210.1 DinB family protein [Gemmatimonadota bacterium]MBK9690114.1 DinB family protein [Gemmatimonadota bacterium]